jgi:hypothetical protein
VRDFFLLSRGVFSSIQPGVEQYQSAELTPARFALLQNRPNPFTQNTTIQFDLPQTAQVSLDIFDPQGRRIVALVNRQYDPGRWTIGWNHRDGNGSAVKPGVYLYRINAGRFRAEKKLVLLP